MMNDISIKAADWQQDKTLLIEVRTQVFVVEQKVPADMEIDGHDADCQHVKALNSNGEIIGTARLLPNRYIGRMCVLKPYRKLGVGGSMLQYFIDYARKHDYPSLMLNAQLSALSFYTKYGFKADSGIFIEADIEHRHMTLSLTE